jgi:hypothetical protein
MILAHIMGIPVEETALQFASAGAVIVSSAIVGRATLGRMVNKLRRR